MYSWMNLGSCEISETKGSFLRKSEGHTFTRCTCSDWYGDQEERSSVRTVPFVIDDGLPRRLTCHLYFYVVFTDLVYTGFRGGLEHLKIETRLIDERLASVMGECEIVTLRL